MKKLQSSVKILFLLCARSLPVAGALAAEPAAPTGPRVFNSGVFINRINSFDIKTGTAEVDLWYWVVSDGEAPSLKNLELSNGKLEATGETITQQKNGKHYVSQRYIATARCRLDISRFPFDRQKIVLSFEDSETGENRFHAKRSFGRRDCVRAGMTRREVPWFTRVVAYFKAVKAVLDAGHRTFFEESFSKGK